MKKLGTVVLLLASTGIAQAASYNIDPTHTFPNFTISHLGFSTQHGRFDNTSGTLEMDLAAKKGSVSIKIDANSINTGFKKRDDHLKSADFFKVAEFPDITFKSTKVMFMGDNAAHVTGDLTMLGQTKQVMLDVKRIQCGPHPFNKKLTEVCGFDATLNIKRSDFGITYGLPAIGDDVAITLQMEANR